jgi:very-short-patch-repair endonuclease
MSRRDRVVLRCERCEQSFEVPRSHSHRRFCSRRCRSNWVRCAHCDREFSAPDNVVRAGGGRFCSQECYWSTLGTRRQLRTCLYCNSQFEAKGAHVEAGAANYCSMRCYQAPRQSAVLPIETRQCLHCGTDFQFQPRPSTAPSKGVYCSQQCMGAASCRRQSGRRSTLERAAERALRAEGVDFQPSACIGPWLVDFLIPDRRLVIECDGKYWHGRPEVSARDRRKNEWMRTHRFHLLRLTSDRATLERAPQIIALALSAL